MLSLSRIEQRRKLIAMVAESVMLADQLNLGLTGITLDHALTQLIGIGVGGPADRDEYAAH